MASPVFSPIALPHSEEIMAKRHEEEAKTGYSPLITVVLSGLLAGVMVWLSPLLLLLLNLLIGLLSGARGASFGKNLLPLMVSPTSLLWLSFSAGTGLASALARRYSVRHGRFWHIPWDKSVTVRFGLDDLMAFTAGTILLWRVLVRSGAGRLMYWLLLAPAPGLLLYALWHVFYAPLIRHLGRVRNSDRVEMIMTGLRSDPYVRNMCGTLGHRFDKDSGKLEIFISNESAQAEDYLRQLLNHLNISELDVRQVHIVHEEI